MLTKEQEDVINSAYLGICILQAVLRKSGLTMGVNLATELLKEMITEFPFLSQSAYKPE
jgi:hypothetical protein